MMDFKEARSSALASGKGRRLEGSLGMNRGREARDMVSGALV